MSDVNIETPVSSSETVELILENNIAWLTLNRPDVMNALNRQTVLALREVLQQLRFHQETRLVVIQGAGEKAFCSGADLKERASLTPNQVREFIYNIRELMNDIETLPQPVIAAVNGLALGGGTELALACDLRVAAENATMGLTETRLAIIPGAGGTQRLSRLVGLGKAKELIYTAKILNAQEACQIGLVNRVVAKESLHESVLELAQSILANGPVAVQQAKYAINFGIETDLRTGLSLESKSYEVCIPTKDRIEALTAFKEKRKPVFSGE